MSQPKDSVVIAIDGTSACGKSTVSRIVARELGYYHVDTGSMYRAYAWKVLKEGIDPTNTAAVVALRDRLKYDCDFVEDEKGTRCLRNRLDGEDPGVAIRKAEVEKAVSPVSAIPEVRTFLVDKQRSLARNGNLVMEGRDIGTVVFPDTPFKFYLDADPSVRAQRRLADPSRLAADARSSEPHPSQVREIGNAIVERDRLDSSRAVAPLKMAEDAVHIDTSAYNAQEVAELVLKHIRKRNRR
jgi:cytidylate kinase